MAMQQALDRSPHPPAASRAVVGEVAGLPAEGLDAVLQLGVAAAENPVNR